MKYIHGGKIRGRISGGAIVRIIFGVILVIYSLIFFVDVFVREEQSVYTSFIFDTLVNIGQSAYSLFFAYSILLFWPGAFLFLFFGIRSLCKTAKGYPRHDASKMLPMEINDLFFTVRCEKCGLAFDYQCSDLSFSAWYKDGYVECPRCRQPVKHSATANTFKVEEINY